MPFNGSGVFSIVNTFVPGTTISSSQMNANFTDIASGLSDCLTRDGQAPMTAALKLVNGTIGGPAIAFASEPTLGFYRNAATVMGLAGGLTASGPISGTSLKVNNSLLIPVGLGPVPWSGTNAPPLWVFANGGSLLRATYTDLWSFANNEISFGNTMWGVGNGTTTFTVPDLRGRVPAGADNIGGGGGVGRLTATTMSPNGTTLGASNAASPSQTVTLAANQIPAGVPSSNISQAISVSPAASFLPVTAGSIGDTSVTTGSGHVPSSTGIWAGTNTLSGNNSISVTSTNAGQQAVNNVQPSLVVNYIIFAGV